MKGLFPWLREIFMGKRPPRCSHDLCDGLADPRCIGGNCTCHCNGIAKVDASGSSCCNHQGVKGRRHEVETKEEVAGASAMAAPSNTVHDSV